MTDMTTAAIPTGVSGLDKMLGGFHVGDNVILEVGVPTPPQGLLDAVIAACATRGQDVYYFGFDASAATLHARLTRHGPHVHLVDGFRHGKGGRAANPTTAPAGTLVIPTPQYPDELRRVMESATDASRQNLFVVDSLSGLAMLWGDEDRVARFYAEVCPALYESGDLAIWLVHRGVHAESFHARIGHIAQVVLSLDLHDGVPALAVERAVGRTDPTLRRPVAYREVGGRFTLEGPVRHESTRKLGE